MAIWTFWFLAIEYVISASHCAAADEPGRCDKTRRATRSKSKSKSWNIEERALPFVSEKVITTDPLFDCSKWSANPLHSTPPRHDLSVKEGKRVSEFSRVVLYFYDELSWSWSVLDTEPRFVSRSRSPDSETISLPAWPGPARPGSDRKKSSLRRPCVAVEFRLVASLSLLTTYIRPRKSTAFLGSP